MFALKWAASLIFTFCLAAAAWAGGDALGRFPPADLKMLGVAAPPAGMRVQGRYRGILFLSPPSRPYTEKQLWLLKYFIDRTPRALLEKGPTAIVNADRRNMPVTVASASGPFVFFDAGSFRTGGFWRAATLEGVFRGFVHELVHVLQFHEAVGRMDLNGARAAFGKSGRRHPWNVEFLRTDLAASFASRTGWKIEDNGYFAFARLEDPRHEKTSVYGRSGLMEDMAETVSLVIVGNLAPLSETRVRWAVELLGHDSVADVIKHTFPRDPTLKEVRMASSVTRFDESKVAMFRRTYPFSDLTHFITGAKFDEVVRRLEKGFAERGWRKISLRRTESKNHVMKASMEYRGKWRDVHVEVISYEAATGYLTKPEKTIITVLGGYHRE